MENNLGKILKERNLSYDRVARDLKKSKTTIANNVKSDTMHSSTMEEYADYLEMEVKEIFKF